jgi:predicted MPP superfamily phosphohydrolase
MISTTQIRAGLRYAKGISRAFNRGEWLPDRVRQTCPTAPGGSGESLPRGGLIRRLRNELDWLTHSVHTVPLQGLERPVRILHLTDVHIRQRNSRLERLCERIAEFHCDLVVLTGDVVAKGWTREAVDLFLQAVPQAPLGRFAIMGNWEHWGGAPHELWGPLLREHDVTLLRDESIDLGPFFLAGTEDLLAAEPNVEQALAGLPLGRQSVVLTHSPGLFPEIARENVGLVLAGHSHGGQFRVPGFGALFVPKATKAFVAGWYSQGDSHLFVSRGIGWSIAPVRLWCPPEIAEIRLVPAG